MEINLPINVRIETTPEFEQAYKEAVESSVEYIKQNIQNEIPSKSGRVKSALKSDIDYEKGEARIGWEKGSKEEMIGSVLEYGSGERGRSGGTYYDGRSGGGYSSPFGESQNHTIPIVPTRNKYMKFMDKDGKEVYLKEFKGHLPQYIFTNAITKSMTNLSTIFDENFNKN